MLNLNKVLTPQEAKQQGFHVDTSCYPWLAYKGPRFKPEEAHHCFTDLEASLMLRLAEQPRLSTFKESSTSKSLLIPMSDELIDACIEALRYKAYNEAGQSQQPDLFSAEDTEEWAQANHLAGIVNKVNRLLPAVPSALQFKERADVLAFQQKFQIPMASAPSWLPDALFEFRFKHLEEELKEFKDTSAAGDMHGAADALVDLVYVAQGIALMMGLPWPMLWAEVQRKNMQKVRAVNAEDPKRSSSFDVLKPEGWTSPDHTAALGVGPWPILKVEA
jgi:hypothetical protein